MSNNSNNVHFPGKRLMCNPYLIIIDNDKIRAANESSAHKMNIIVVLKLFWKVYQKYSININRKSETPGNFGCPKGVEKSELFSQETYYSKVQI